MRTQWGGELRDWGRNWICKLTPRSIKLYESLTKYYRFTWYIKLPHRKNKTCYRKCRANWKPHNIPFSVYRISCTVLLFLSAVHVSRDITRQPTRPATMTCGPFRKTKTEARSGPFVICVFICGQLDDKPTRNKNPFESCWLASGCTVFTLCLMQCGWTTINIIIGSNLNAFRGSILLLHWMISTPGSSIAASGSSIHPSIHSSCPGHTLGNGIPGDLIRFLSNIFSNRWLRMIKVSGCVGGG